MGEEKYVNFPSNELSNRLKPHSREERTEQPNLTEWMSIAISPTLLFNNNNNNNNNNIGLLNTHIGT